MIYYHIIWLTNLHTYVTNHAIHNSHHTHEILKYAYHNWSCFSALQCLIWSLQYFEPIFWERQQLEKKSIIRRKEKSWGRATYCFQFDCNQTYACFSWSTEPRWSSQQSWFACCSWTWFSRTMCTTGAFHHYSCLHCVICCIDCIILKDGHLYELFDHTCEGHASKYVIACWRLIIFENFCCNHYEIAGEWLV